MNHLFFQDDLSERFNRVNLGEADYSTMYHPPELGITSSPYGHWRAYKHHQWVIFTPDTVRFFRTDPDALNFLAFTEHTYIPDEHYFGTGTLFVLSDFIVMINSPHFQNKVINNNKRYLRFTGGAHPAWLGYKDRHLFPANEPEPSFFFIRKLNSRGKLFGEKDLISWIHQTHFKKKSYGVSISPGTCTVEKMSVRSECFKEIGSTIAVKDSVTIIPVNMPYLATAKNLACSLARLGVKNVIYWALDLDVYETLLKQDKIVILLPGLNPLPDFQSSKSYLLKRVLRSKPELLKFVLESGLSAWLVDADVVAVQDFTAIQDPTTDIFVSLDEKTISSSVVFYRSNNRTLDFVHKMQVELDRSSGLDDEEALRRVILKTGAAEVLQANHEKLYPKEDGNPRKKSGNEKLIPMKTTIRFLDPFAFISSTKIPHGFTDYYTLHTKGENAKSVFNSKGYWYVDEEGYCLIPEFDKIIPNLLLSE